VNRVALGASIAALVCAASGCGERPAESVPRAPIDGDTTQAATPAATSTAPAKTRAVSVQNFSTRTVEGKSLRFSDYAGKRPIVMGFWSTFCQPCLAAFPHLKRISAEYKDRGLVFLAISMDGPETVANVPAYVQRNGLTGFPVAYDEDSHIASLYNPKKVEPFFLIFDRNGQVVATHEGFNAGDESQIEDAVRQAVR
jgi:peroxiredoxin